MLKGMTGATGNFYCGLHEYKEMTFLLHFLVKEDVFVDIGANIGSYTILASAEVGAYTYSIEPVQNTYIQLDNNIGVNNIYSNVKLLNIGVASKKGELVFSDEHDTSMNHVLVAGEELGKNRKVSVETLDDILGNVSPSLIKIDVEGFEMEVLKGALTTLNKEGLKAIIIELNGSGLNYGFKDEDIVELLISYGFRAYTYDPFERKLSAAELHDYDNLIYIRDINFVMNRLKNSPKIKVLSIEI